MLPVIFKIFNFLFLVSNRPKRRSFCDVVLSKNKKKLNQIKDNKPAS